ncbi:MAG: DUF2357 domain-containing protein [Bacilli bacterium]
MDDRNKSEESKVILNSLQSLLSVKRNYEDKKLNDEWLNIFEEIIPYIDNILRNPKRFIVNEEEIVKVELAKKVTVESIIHLTQHTSLIQDYDPIKGDVRPSKILNINKDESIDTYENRFIFTLVNNMRYFIELRLREFNGESSFYDKLDLEYNGTMKIKTEDIKVSINYQSTNKSIDDLDKENSFDSRLKTIKTQLDAFTNTELMITLNKLHVSAVQSPIHKTNVILKNPNFQQASRLWNYIQSYIKEEYKITKDNQDYLDSGQLKEQFDQGVLLFYLATELISEKKHHLSENKALSLTINKLLENIIDFDPNLTEKKIKELFHKQIKIVKEKSINREKIIFKAFKYKFNIISDNLKESYLILE